MTDAPWTIQVSSEARRGLERLPQRVAVAVVEFITGPLADNPIRLSKPLTRDLAAFRSARRGDYRVIIEVREADRAVVVIRISHRAHIYRPR